MATNCKPAAICFGLALLLVPSIKCGAQDKSPAPPAPTPAPLHTAQKVFIANAGGDESRNEYAYYTGGPNRAYNDLYAAMQAWGRYTLVSAPGDADLVFEIRFSVPQMNRVRILGDDETTYDPQIRLVIRDVKTHQILWGLTEHAQGAVSQGNRDKNFAQAMAAIVNEIKRIAGASATVPAR